MKVKKFLSIIACLVLCLCVMTACGSSSSSGGASDSGNTSSASSSSSSEDSSSSQSASTSAENSVKQFSDDELLSGKHHVEMVIKDHGTVTLGLDADQAPITVTNFVQLVEQGFYDGLTFHRIIPGEFVQGGDPNGNGTGTAGYNIKGEFSANGVDNTLSHTRGAISMARTSDYDGGSCQFFIMDADYTDFDGQYACFGYVTDGMDIIDDICNNTTVQDQNGTVATDDQPVIESMTVID
jgi:peptidyl-prolyl cis-trans isomerase B (cyclophilin B)